MKTPFFTKLRDWQAGYSYKVPAEKAGNEIVPCPIRDHHDEFNRIAKENKAIPVGKTTEVAFKDKKFIKDLTDIGKKTDKATKDLWVQEYQKL